VKKLVPFVLSSAILLALGGASMGSAHAAVRFTAAPPVTTSVGPAVHPAGWWATDATVQIAVNFAVTNWISGASFSSGMHASAPSTGAKANTFDQ